MTEDPEQRAASGVSTQFGSSAGWVTRQTMLAAAASIPLGLTWGAELAAEFSFPIIPVAVGAVVALWAVLRFAGSTTPSPGPEGLPRRFRVSPIDVATIAVVLGLGVLGFVPHETVLGGRDSGVYVNTAITIARTGQIHFLDETLESLGAGFDHIVVGRTPEPWIRPGMPGYQVFDLNHYEFQPHGFHGWPSLLALAYTVAGLSGVFLVPILLRIWNLVLMALLARLIGGPVTGLLAVLLLGTNVGELWYGRSHAAEILVQTAILTGVVFGVHALRTKSAAAAFVAGFAFGVVHLTKIEFVLIPPFLLIVVTVLLSRGFGLGSIAWFAAPYTTLLLHSAAHAIALAPAYTIGQLKAMVPRLDWSALDRADAYRPFGVELWGDLVASNLTIVLAAVFLCLTGCYLLWYLASGTSVFAARAGSGGSRPMLVALVAGLLFVLLSRGAALAAPNQVGPLVTFAILGDPESLWDVQLYVGLLGLALAALGAILAAFRARDTADRVALAFVVVEIAPLLFAKLLADDHFWAGRRYVPLLIPAFALYCGSALVWVTGWMLRRMETAKGRIAGMVAAMAVASALVALNLSSAMPVLAHSENAGASARLLELARGLPDDGIVLMPWGDYAGLLITPLVVQYRKPVLALESERAGDARIVELMQSLHTNGRRLYWLGTQLPGLSPALESLRVADLPFGVPRAEAPVGRLPNRIYWYEYSLVLYEIAARTDQSE